MKDYIREELERMGSEGQLNEIDLSSIISNLKGLVSSKKSRINKEFAIMLAKKFDGEFAKYLKKRLMKSGRNVNTLEKVMNYVDNYSAGNYDDVFEILGIPMLDFFVNKTFGQQSLGGKIKQMTPFLKKVSTGNSELDKYIFNAISKSLNDKKVRRDFKVKLRDTIDDKLVDVLDDKDYEDLVKSFTGVDESKENLDEAGKLKRAARGLRNIFSTRETKTKFKILDDILDYMPKMKKNLKREIKKDLFDMDYEDVVDMVDNYQFEKAAKIATKPIMRHIIKNSQDIYFKDDSFKDFVEITKDVFLDQDVVGFVEKAVRSFMRETLKRAKEAERKKQK